jgi:hypothetical protein
MLFFNLFNILLVLRLSKALGRTLQHHNESVFWEMHHQSGVLKNQNLKLSKLNHPTNPYHTCYRVLCYGNQCPSDGAVREFCYPAVIITGTSCVIIWSLLSKRHSSNLIVTQGCRNVLQVPCTTC